MTANDVIRSVGGAMAFATWLTYWSSWLCHKEELGRFADKVFRSQFTGTSLHTILTISTSMYSFSLHKLNLEFVELSRML